MENETSNENEDSNPNEENSFVSDNDSDKVVKKNEEKGDFSYNTETNDPNKPPLIVQIQKEKGWTKQDIIAIVAVLISAILFVITLLTFRQTKRSVDIAAQAMKEAIINDSAMRARDSIKFSSDTAFAIKKFIQDTISANESFSLSSNILQTQINALKETQKEFELENRPFVQVSEIKIDTSGYKALLSFKIRNYGKFPADVLYVKYRIGAAVSRDENKIVYLKTQTSEHNIYIASGVNYLPEFGAMTSSSKHPLSAMKDGEIVMYLYVEIKYTTYGTKSTFLHTSLNKIKYGVSNLALINNDIEVR
jgi:hypothetical protein